MSTISAGTTSNTALKQTGDTTGNLVLQINGTTTALTLNTSGAVGVGTSPSYGTSGQVLTSGGTAAAPTWTTVSGGGSPGGSNTQFQYNNSSAFAGAANLVYNANGPIVSSLGVGSTTPSASGAGIAFPATQSASSDANTLDDYEEGTWNPGQGSALSGVTGTFTASGNYTKVGRLVTVNFTASATSFTYTAGSGSLVSGLPFAVGAFSSYGGGVNASGTTNLPIYGLATITNVYCTLTFTSSSVSGTITYFV
jgi:hypothetical protein